MGLVGGGGGSVFSEHRAVADDTPLVLRHVGAGMHGGDVVPQDHVALAPHGARKCRPRATVEERSAAARALHGCAIYSLKVASTMSSANISSNTSIIKALSRSDGSKLRAQRR